jgi:MFS family permease
MIVIYSAFALLLVSFGAAIMSLEILSSNLMSPFFGGSVYIWGSIISTFMVHLSLGYVLGGYLSKRNTSLFILNLLLILASLWIISIPKIHIAICELILDRIFDVRFGSLLAMNLIFFVPITIMSTVSPYIIGLISHNDRKSGFSAGLVMFISTVGSFIGTNVTAFYLINLFPVSKIIFGLGLYCLFISLFIITMKIDRRLKHRTFPAITHHGAEEMSSRQ